ncbi:nuclear transport factor 2 family protein [Pseudomonas kurunegalensis]|uniref:nuclear transport factor 2 family protein n=1 Tax=Pseudomonas kurunegalensis TaxID=485880 RepID=UPI002570111C|nr:nuclear transport factor 2 family protein [Pseudomonas kurunegalensis]WJD60700.1 nuclear transport factor 2 family protein [Pseudomonas kurunegalensis]
MSAFLKGTDMNIATNQLNDLQILTDLLGRYAWGYDANDPALLGSALSKDAVSGGVITGSSQSWGPWTGREAIASNLSALRSGQTDQRRHTLSTPLIVSLTETQATLKVYLTLYVIQSPARPQIMATGTYHVEFSKHDGIWLIDRLDAQLDSEF